MIGKLRDPGAVRGFTLLELMIVITIIIILAAITLPQYQRTIVAAREAVLRDDLSRMRSLIDQFAADKGRLPQSLDELATEGYMREVPLDPFTNQKDWAITTGEDPNSTEGQSGMTDIHSSSGELVVSASKLSITLHLSPSFTKSTFTVLPSAIPYSMVWYC